jgi:membrane protein
MAGIPRRRPHGREVDPVSPRSEAATASDVRPRLSSRAIGWCADTCGLAGRAVVRGVIEFLRSSNLTFAASIAYYMLLSLFPFLLLVISILSRLAVGGSGSEVALQHIIARALPSHFDFVVRQLRELAATPLNFSLAGTVVTLWASMGVFGAITSAVNHAWGVEQSYGFFKHKLIAFAMMAAAGVLAVAALLLMSTVQVVEASWFSGIMARFPKLGVLTGFVYRHLPTPMFIVVVGLIYYYVPNAQVRLRDVWLGAILAAVLWRLAFAGFAWYVRDLSRFNVHGSVAAVVVFLLWVYLSAVILLYGVEVTAAYARLRKRLPQEMPAAPVRD